MMSELVPEQIELNKKRRVLERLKDRLADQEEDMADLRAELEQFEARYKMEVGRLYAEQDEIDAQIAEEEVKLVPDDEEIKKRAEELRRRAEQSAADAEGGDKAFTKFNPTPEAKKAYHDLARVIHPDLALDPEEKEKRHDLMASLNDAYASGDQKRLDMLAEEFRHSPDLVRGETPGDELVRAIRQLYQIRKRLQDIKKEKAQAESSELYELRRKVVAELAEGRDLLKHMAARAKTHIRKSERRLENLRNVNAAQEEYVKERYGMDISEFRGSPKN